MWQGEVKKVVMLKPFADNGFRVSWEPQKYIESRAVRCQDKKIHNRLDEV